MTNLKKFIFGVVVRFKQFDKQKYAWRNLDKTKLLVPFRLFAHPIDTFNDIKYEGRGSVGIANLMLALFFFESVFDYFTVGYLFTNNEPQYFSVFPILMKTVGIVVVWCVVNWAMCALLDGDGTFKDIYMATCYSLLPIVLFLIPLDLLSNVITNTEGMFYSTFTTIIYAWAILFVFLGMMMVHQFTVAKTIGSVVLSLAIMVILVFLVLLSFSIFQQMSAFVKTVMTEILRR